MFDAHVNLYHSVRARWLTTTYVMPWNEYVKLMFSE